MPELTFNMYQELAARTSGAGKDGEQRQIIAALGLAGEAGEFANLIKKMTAHGHPTSKDILMDELGDVLWYLAEAATSCAGERYFYLGALAVDPPASRPEDSGALVDMDDQRILFHRKKLHLGVEVDRNRPARAEGYRVCGHLAGTSHVGPPADLVIVLVDMLHLHHLPQFFVELLDRKVSLAL